MCPECRKGIIKQSSCNTWHCAECAQQFPVVDGLPFLFPTASIAEHVRIDSDGKAGPARALEPGSTGGEYHWKEYQIEEFLPPSGVAKEVLLLGCGDAGERPFLEEKGYEIVAFDIKRSSGADFLADAHTIPLGDCSFDLVLSMQVLEHLHSPWIAIQHIARILRPGGWFVGSVAFLKPYHQSYFHMSHLGVINLLGSHGLKVDKLAGAQSLSYSLYGSLTPLGPRSVSRAVYGTWDRIIHSVRARLWSFKTRLDPAEPTNRFGAGIPLGFAAFDKLRFAPAVVFRAQKVVSTD